MNRLKVLHVIDNFGVGGAEAWLLSVVKYLHANPTSNLQFDFLATSGKPSVYDEEVKKYGCRIYYIKYSFGNIFSFGRRFRCLLSQNSYDIIHNHQDFVSGWHFLLALGLLPSLKISHLHNSKQFVWNYVSNPIRWLSFKIGRLLMFVLTDKITGTSSKVMDDYGYNRWPFNIKRYIPIYCGIQVDNFTYNPSARNSLCEELGWNSDAAKIGMFIGRIGNDDNMLQTTKNPFFAYEIAKYLIAGDRNWKFLFVGYKGLAGGLMEKQITDLKLNDNIKVLGVRKDVGEMMSAADILVFPSKYEGLGMVVVEAQTTGLPVIMSESIPEESIICRELVVSKALVDGSKAWAAKIDADFHVRNDRTSCAERIKDSPFSIQNSINELIRLYNSK